MATPTLDPRRVPVTVERDTAIAAGERLAIIASHGDTPRISRSLAALSRALRNAGYPVVLVRASDDQTPLEWAAPDGVTVLRKPNLGYDFGSWAVGLHHARRHLRRRHVLLANDSLAGPFAPIGHLIDAFEASTTDAWAAVASTEIDHHLQSYLLGFNGGVLADPALRTFFNTLPLEIDKQRIVQRYELGLSRLLRAEAYTLTAAIEPELVAAGDANPTLLAWRGLLDQGFPFIKRSLLRDPTLAPDGADIADEIGRRYNTNPHEWIDTP